MDTLNTNLLDCLSPIVSNVGYTFFTNLRSRDVASDGHFDS